MIPKLRKKFISITAAALFTFILLVMIALNSIFIYQSNLSLDRKLDMLLNSSISHAPDNMPPNIEPSKEDEPLAPKFFTGVFHGFADKLHIRTDGCLILLNSDGTIRELRQDADYSAEALQDMVSQILSSEKQEGWQSYFKYRLTSRTNPQGTVETVIGLLNASADIYSICSMLLISGSIGIISFVMVLAIIIFASGRAVTPIAESYIKQKQFVTDAGHELKTPLTVISANNELARMIYGDSEWFDSIDNQVAKMNTLVQNLILLAKMDEERKPVFSSFHLSDAVYDTAKSFENLIHATKRVITFDIMEDITCTGDEALLRQALSILIDNAVKYCDEQGKISVRLKQDKWIRLQVINDYSVSEECDFSRVFERFYRADKARTSDGSYGLGLSIAKSIIELHKGSITAKRLEHDRVMFEILLK